MPLPIHAQFAQSARQLRTGANILAGWLGEGGIPVNETLAEDRAKICAACPHNHPVSWAGFAKAGVAQTVMAAERLAHHAQMRTAEHDRLGECEICGCYLKLKVWCPIEHIKTEMTAEDLQSHPAPCWIRKELQ